MNHLTYLSAPSPSSSEDQETKSQVTGQEAEDQDTAQKL